MKKRNHLAMLESRFPDLAVRKDRGGRSFRSAAGREVFRVDSSGSTLTLPVPRNLIEDLFGGLPFPVEARESGSVVRLDTVSESDLLFDLIDALHEQGLEGPPPDAAPTARPVATTSREGKAAPPPARESSPGPSFSESRCSSPSSSCSPGPSPRRRSTRTGSARSRPCSAADPAPPAGDTCG